MEYLSFTKMQALGNDFVVIDGRGKNLRNLPKLARRVCKRRFGIGADQMLVLLDSACAHFRMRIFNPDGSEAQMCGNGIRCIARYVIDKQLTEHTQLQIETLAGLIKLKVIGEDKIEVDMGVPILEAQKIPLNLEGKVISVPLRVEDQEFYITCVSMGNPHCVIFLDQVADFPLSQYGPKLERHPWFPERTNVELVQVLGPQALRVRVWERGAGQTLACGTGACAAVVAAVLNNKTQRRVAVHLPGGVLDIWWSPEDNHVYMRGPAEMVFEGKYKYSQ